MRGIKLVLNVFSYIKSILNVWKKTDIPPNLIYFVTSQCNARCKYCFFMDKILDTSRREKELSLEEITIFAKKYGNLSKLSLSGGEPFIRKDIAEIVQTFIDNCGVQIIDIPTNAFFTESIISQTTKILQSNPNIVLEIQMSIDGPEEIHDELRGVKGLYKKTINTLNELEILRKKYPKLRLKMNYVFQQGNQEKIMDVAKYFEQNHSFNRFQIVFPHGDNKLEKKINELSYKKYYDISRKIQLKMKLHSKFDLHSLLFRSIKIMRDEVMIDIMNNGDMGNICHAGERVIVVDDIGEVFPCEPIWYSVGNLRDYDFSIKKIVDSEKMNEFKTKHLGKNKCHCSWVNIALDQIIHNPKYYPKLIYYFLYLLLFGGRGLDK